MPGAFITMAAHIPKIAATNNQIGQTNKKWKARMHSLEFGWALCWFKQP
jgi:hypothetical protein